MLVDEARCFVEYLWEMFVKTLGHEEHKASSKRLRGEFEIEMADELALKEYALKKLEARSLLTRFLVRQVLEDIVRAEAEKTL